MKHLRLVNEGYFKHLIEAWLFVTILIFAAVVCFIHSILPFLFQSTASKKIQWILNRTNERKASNE